MSIQAVRTQPLFEVGRIGNLEVRNRLVQAPIFTQFASTWGEVDDRLIEYHRARARGGIGLIITENTSVDWELGRTVGNPMRIDHDRFRAGLHDLVEAVHDEGAKIAVQLHHTGRQNSQGNTERNEPPIAPTAGITSAFGTPPRAIELAEIPELVDKYVQGARRAQAAGFDAVELHGAHGYLFSQFLSPKTNHRTDDYGGSLENRARFAIDVLKGVRAAVGPDYPVMYRLSVEEPYEGGLEVKDSLEFCEMIEPYIDALDITSGNYDTALTLLPMVPPGSLVGFARAVKERVSLPVIAVGRLTWLMDDMADAIAAGEFDFIALGRSQLADPETPNKTRLGEHRRVRRCIAVNECVSRWMFAGERTQCVINPALSQERRAQEALRPVAVARSVLVIGAGPAGCEAAIMAAERGHEVTLYERSERIGGQLNAWTAASVLQHEVGALIDFYEAELERLGVDVRTNSEVDPTDLGTYDQVLIATGTEPGELPAGAVDATEMLAERVTPDAEQVVVFGAGETAMFAALWLAERGKSTRLMSPAADVGVDTNDMQRMYLSELLANAGVAVATDCDPPDSLDGVACIWAGDRSPTSDLDEFVDGDRVRVIGTRLRGGRLYEATQSGFWSAAGI